MTNKINWWDKLKEMWILWQHDGDCSKPHALLTSGKHSDAFNNGSKLVESPIMLSLVVNWMMENIDWLVEKEKPIWVVWPAFWAITIWHELARQLNTKFAFTEPVQTPEGKMQVLKRFDIKAWDTVLVVEDAITTWWSIVKTINALEEAWAIVLPYVATIVNWSWSDKLWDRQIHALFDWKMNIWENDNCELCKCGSEAMRPKANRDKFSNKK